MTKQEQTSHTRQAHFVQLPTRGKLALYARVATRDKLTGTEPSAQIEELQAQASALGFDSERVATFVDEGVGAAASLPERQGYAALLAAIQAGEITALFLHSEDRLFADASELQVNAFIQLCIEKKVSMITSHMVYDFRDPSRVALFRANCLRAFEFLAHAVRRTRRETGGRGKRGGQD